MNAFDALTASAGSWRGTSKLHDPNTGKPDDSRSTLIVTPVLGGRFVRLDYGWSYQEKPQEGSLLLGFDRKADTATAHWIDTWHMSSKVMACNGPGTDGSTISLRGSWAAPPGPDWGWRIDVTAGDELRIVMWNVWPDGSREDLAVEATYTRA
jgi:hypothetical protein